MFDSEYNHWNFIPKNNLSYEPVEEYLSQEQKKEKPFLGMPLCLIKDLTELNLIDNVYVHASEIMFFSKLESVIRVESKFNIEPRTIEDIKIYYDLWDGEIKAFPRRDIKWFPGDGYYIKSGDYFPILFVEKPKQSGFLSRKINSFRKNPRTYKRTFL
jgi:hypothetical protein